MQLNWNNQQFDFYGVPIHFADGTHRNVFSRKNNKTLGETILHNRYAPLAAETRRQYPHQLNSPIGTFLMNLKRDGDEFYLNFLNIYGDLTYSQFWIEDKNILGRRGLYIFANHDGLLYLGRCLDSFGFRINQGYGTIQPKNCFIDGQSVNCRNNSLITGCAGKIQFMVCPIDEKPKIVAAEAGLIQKYRPPWNVQGVKNFYQACCNPKPQTKDNHERLENVMPHRDVILAYLRQNDGGCCDDCLSTKTQILPRQQVNQICHELERQGAITRKTGYCGCSDRQKIKNSLRVRK